MKKRHLIFSIIILSTSLVLVMIFCCFPKVFFQQAEVVETPVVTEDSFEGIIIDNSMIGIFEEGQNLFLDEDYYLNNKVKKGDTVLYSYSDNSPGVIRSVFALEGDTFSLKQSGDKWVLSINGKYATNTKNERYLLEDYQYDILNMYAEDFNGVIPEGAAIILANDISNKNDSRYFGLMATEDLTGKVTSK